MNTTTQTPREIDAKLAAIWTKLTDIWTEIAAVERQIATYDSEKPAQYLAKLAEQRAILADLHDWERAVANLHMEWSRRRQGATMNATTKPDHTDAATAQPSDYSGVTTADLAEILATLSTEPASLQVMAVLGRVRGELQRRDRHERTEAVRATAYRRAYRGATAAG
jgi:hypothetical protein